MLIGPYRHVDHITWDASCDCPKAFELLDFSISASPPSPLMAFVEKLTWRHVTAIPVSLKYESFQIINSQTGLQRPPLELKKQLLFRDGCYSEGCSSKISINVGLMGVRPVVVHRWSLEQVWLYSDFGFWNLLNNFSLLKNPGLTVVTLIFEIYLTIFIYWKISVNMYYLHFIVKMVSWNLVSVSFIHTIVIYLTVP
jgi:hypothetical protein